VRLAVADRGPSSRSEEKSADVILVVGQLLWVGEEDEYETSDDDGEVDYGQAKERPEILSIVVDRRSPGSMIRRPPPRLVLVEFHR